MDDASARTLLRRLFDAAIAEKAEPAKIVPRHLPSLPKGRTVVVGAGKASAAMARAVEQNWRGRSGLVVTPLRTRRALRAHRDRRGGASGARHRGRGRRDAHLERVAGLKRRRPRAGADIRRRLVAAGAARAGVEPGRQAAITRRCCARRADRRDELRAQAPVGDQGRSARGRRLAGQVVTLMISDVPGDDPSVIASGPTVADPTTCADALQRAARNRLDRLPRP